MPVNANNPIDKQKNSKSAIVIEIYSFENLQELLYQIEQEIHKGNTFELKIVNPIAVVYEQITTLHLFGSFLIEYGSKILLIWQDSFLYPEKNGMYLSHYEWWKWNYLKLGVNPDKDAKWQIESVELYLFVNDEQPEDIFDIVESLYENPFYINSIGNKLQCQGFPRPRDSYNLAKYPGYPGWEPNGAHDVPEDIVETMSSQALIQALWEYPILYNIFVSYHFRYNLASSVFFSSHSAYKELIKRTDAGTAFLYRFSKMNYLISGVPYDPNAFELIMAKQTLLTQLNDAKKKQLIKLIMQNDSLRQKENFPYTNIRTIWFLIGKTLINANYEPFIEYMNENEELWNYLQLLHYDHLFPYFEPEHIIIEYSENYLNKDIFVIPEFDYPNYDFHINLSLQNGAVATGALVTLQGINGDNVFDKISNETGVIFENVKHGFYNLKISLEGFNDYTAYNVIINATNVSHNALLVQNTNIDKNFQNKIILTPNPVRNMLTINRPETDKVMVEIYNNFGVLQQTSVSYDNEINIDISDYSAGFYLIRLNDFKTSATKTFMKE